MWSICWSWSRVNTNKNTNLKKNCYLYVDYKLSMSDKKLFTLLTHEPKYSVIGSQEVLFQQFSFFFFRNNGVKKITKRKYLNKEWYWPLQSISKTMLKISLFIKILWNNIKTICNYDPTIARWLLKGSRTCDWFCLWLHITDFIMASVAQCGSWASWLHL